MKITRIESLLFGVEDVATSARYYDDWGLPRVWEKHPGWAFWEIDQ